MNVYRMCFAELFKIAKQEIQVQREAIERDEFEKQDTLKSLQEVLEVLNRAERITEIENDGMPFIVEKWY